MSTHTINGSESPRFETDETFKIAIELFFQPMIQLFCPHLYPLIDWNQPYEFLDKELQQIHPQHQTKRRLVDKLVKVYLLNGSQQWILVHTEIQAQHKGDFAQRMFEYFYRLMDRYRRPVYSMAILADTSRQWRPAAYDYAFHETQMHFEFLCVKLLDFENQMEALEQSQNPFAWVVLAYLKKLATRDDLRLRVSERLNLVRNLVKQGYNVEEAVSLFRLLEFMLDLPPQLELEFDQQLKELKQEMPETTLLSRFERQAMERGRQEGRQEGLLLHARESLLEVLRAKFGKTPRSLEAQIHRMEDPDQLRYWLRRAVLANSLKEFSEEFKQS